MFLEDSTNHILVDVDLQCVVDDEGDSWASESRITTFEFNDKLDHVVSRAFGTGLEWGFGRKQLVVLSLYQKFVELFDRRRLNHHGDAMESLRIDKLCTESEYQSVGDSQIGSTFSRSIKYDELLFQREVFSCECLGATRTKHQEEAASNVDEAEKESSH